MFVSLPTLDAKVLLEKPTVPINEYSKKKEGQNKIGKQILTILRFDLEAIW